MNIPLAKELLALLNSPMVSEPGAFSIERWHENKLIGPKPSCGFAACVGGWLAQIPSSGCFIDSESWLRSVDLRVDALDGYNVISASLGITYGEARHLASPEHYNDFWDEEKEEYDNESIRKEAVKRLEALILSYQSEAESQTKP